jgi:predicted O-methyltransferase YrrM
MKKDSLSKALLLFGRLCKLPFVNPRGLQEVLGVAFATTEGVMDPENDVLPVPGIYLEDLVREQDINSADVTVRLFARIKFSILLEEALALGVLMQMCKASRAFEFGTHRGISSSQLAANLPEHGRLFTLDLPRSDTRTRFTVDDAAEKEVANFAVKGDMIPEHLRKKVTFLEQDSALFDPTSYKESMDFVFIDGAHTIEYVANDSEKAWTMLKPGGIVAWHDCRAQSPDVVKYLRSCKFYPRRIRNTTLAFAEKPKA